MKLKLRSLVIHVMHIEYPKVVSQIRESDLDTRGVKKH